MKQKFLFDKDNLKVTRVIRYDDIPVAVSFTFKNQKFFVREGYGDEGDYIELYAVDNFGTRTRVADDYGGGVGTVEQFDDSAINHRYAQWTHKVVNVRGHSKKQALLSVPYSQYQLDGFVDMLNSHFGMNKEAIQARDWVASYIERSISELENIKAKDSYLKPFLKDYPNICKEINAVIKQLKPIQKKVEATTF